MTHNPFFVLTAVLAVGSVVLAVEAPDDGWTWYEKDALPLEGRGFKDPENYYGRLPARARGKILPGAMGQSTQATGLYVRFTTDSDRLAIRWKVENENPRDPLIPEAGMTGVDVYRFDAKTKNWVFAGNKRYWGNGARLKVPGVAEISWRPGEAGLVYLPFRSKMLEFRLGVKKGKTLKAFPHADPAAKPVVHYGTSIVHGGCASRAGLMFTSIAGRALDREYVNLGFSGNGKMEQGFVPLLAEIDAAVYVVDCTWNMDRNMVETNAVRFLNALRDAKPDVPILLCDGCTQRPHRRNVDELLRAKYDALKNSDPARWRNLYYFNYADMLPVDDECTHDFCHPNDSGMRVMGEAYAKRIREVLEAVSAPAAPALAVDFDAATGPVKPVNGVGQPPITSWNNYGMFHYLKEAGIPYSRLHDVGGPFAKNVYVDIPNLFRDFDADENDPASYDFTFTDGLLKALVEVGVEPYFRLGVTIENAQRTKIYRIVPPRDFAKWARICEHVIRHYTEGWANGFRHDISHWEIWNEPDSFETLEKNLMWKDTFDRYCDLYVTTASHLKRKFPHLKIGGYASCGFYGVSSSWAKPTNPRIPHLMGCFTNFLERVRSAGAPLDFFSYHCYDKPVHAAKQIDYCRRTLNDFGFTKTETSLNEWLPCRGGSRQAEIGTAGQAAQIAAMLAIMQNGPVDDAEIYDARATGGSYAPLFAPETHQPRKAYYVYLAFNELRKLGRAVKVTGTNEDLWACAATDGKKGAVMVANVSAKTLPLAQCLGGRKPVRVRVIDDRRDFAQVDPDGTIAGESVALLEFE